VLPRHGAAASEITCIARGVGAAPCVVSATLRPGLVMSALVFPPRAIAGYSRPRSGSGIGSIRSTTPVTPGTVRASTISPWRIVSDRA